MREVSTPPLADLSDYRNVTDLLVRRVAVAPDHIAFDVAAPGGWRTVSTAEFGHEVWGVARGLVAAGLQPGQSVAIMSSTRYEWAVADLAIWFAGGVVVPVYESSAASQVSAIVADADVRIAFAGDDRARTALLDAGVPLVIDLQGGLAGLIDLGADVPCDDVERARVHAGPDSPATIVYTSGTTGHPKAAVLTHENFLGQVLNIAAAYSDIVRSDGNTVIFLPLAHVLARGLQLICLASGMRIAHLATPSEVVASLGVLRPTFLVVVPRVLEKIVASAAAKADEKHLGRLWAGAMRAATDAGTRAERSDDGTVVKSPTALTLRHRLYDLLFYRRLRAVLGGRLRYVLSGGATLSPRLSLLFRGMGIPVIEGYGLTETTAPLTGNLPGAIRSGTVGLPLPGSTVRIADDGEVLARGVGVFAGYRDAADDAQAFVDGFFRTGDLGRLDERGRLVLEGRVKDVVTTSHGKTVAPARWEAAIEEHPLISSAVTVGEGRPYLTALIVLDRDAVGADIDDSQLRADIQRAVDEANALVSRSEQVRRFALVVADSDDREVMTPTLKIRRRELLHREAATVDALYG
ncbi:AMP-dependent synthetase/ligase [Microbacterium dextranolyticum]|uniref:Long-chain-fatty-acid--CoA ligase n=1 Tax=Microbacterium dextranolyticum TaxID=36806 RepID=A0A9W6HM08_9MICO|nr:long-chain fatty acid--CoA ligase [Microbacterium dextranolyticum]MBM7463911.1 long-chain acyl-CoA synthetase [Microbacterium dextranolyticum]GLJ94993.1 long-chain-fatty-acid--CoA ligase [Microbacterium dextranolyticum]